MFLGLVPQMGNAGLDHEARSAKIMEFFGVGIAAWRSVCLSRLKLGISCDRAMNLERKLRG